MRPGEASRKLLPPTTLIKDAHDVGLFVDTWTFRNEQRRLVSDYAGNPVNEYLQFYKLGIDGVFSDFADTAVVARILLELERNPDGGRCLTGDRDGPMRHRPECPGRDHRAQSRRRPGPTKELSARPPARAPGARARACRPRSLPARAAAPA